MVPVIETQKPVLSTTADDRQLEFSQRLDMSYAGQRLDQAAVSLFPEFSRNQLQAWIKQGQLSLNGKAVKASQRLQGGELLELQAELEKHDDYVAQPMDLDFLYEDEHLLVVNKPVGMVVHPAAGNWDGTLVNGLLHFDPSLEVLPRAGIIHRLDKDTSGALLIGRTPEVRQRLVDMMQERLIRRRYYALVWGRPEHAMTIDAPIGRHPRERTRMAVVSAGKPARTHCRREQRWAHAAALRIQLDTGRTHQIRVHCSHVGYPLVGDPSYGKKRLPADLDPRLALQLKHFERQALHAYELAFDHPVSSAPLCLHAAQPGDIQSLVQAFDDYDSL